MICSQKISIFLTQTKFYKSQSQYLPTDNILQLESETSLLDLSRRKMLHSNKILNYGKKSPQIYSDKLAWVYISSAAYVQFVCMQRQTISLPTLSRLIETVAKSIKACDDYFYIWATEILQAKRDALLAMFKILLDNSNHELRNTPIYSKPYLITNYGSTKGKFEVQQQRSLAKSSIANTIQQQQSDLSSFSGLQETEAAN